ncbi:YciI family protein [Microbacterium sp. KR10-403]|uniref:YciI family protein n=1 Tax=Microbacterium sp. KR10-403 TaxID=3158581 RepID=UPI0032E3D83B
MSTFVVIYQYADDSEESRNVHRPDHVAFLTRLHDEGVLYMSGPLVDDPPRATLILEEADRAALEARMDQDPFFANGLIARRDIAEWRVVFDPRTAQG